MFKKTTTRAELIHKDTGRRADADSTTYRYPGGWLFISRNRLYHWNKNRGEESVALIGVQLEVNGTGQISSGSRPAGCLRWGCWGRPRRSMTASSTWSFKAREVVPVAVEVR